MTRDFVIGLGFVFNGFSLLTRKGIARFVLVPLLINTLTFSTAIWTGYRTFNNLMESFTRWVPDWLDWIQWLLWPLAILMVLVIVYYSFSLLANLIAAPFNSLLAERAEAVITGSMRESQSYKKIPSMLARTTWSEFRKIVYQLKWMIALIVVSFIPGINVIAPFGWLYFGAWMLSVNYTDYPMGNHDLYFKQVKQQLKKDRFCALGLGGGIMLITLIPVINFIAMPLGVVSATLYWVTRLSKIIPN